MDWTKHQKSMIVGGRRLSYLDIGTGPEAVLLLHGLAGSWQWWMENLEELSESRRVIAVDVPGFGKSEPAISQNMDGIVDCLESLCEELDLGTVDVVGHSMGTVLAAELAARVPQRVRRLTFTGGPIISVMGLLSSPLKTLRKRPAIAIFLIEAVTAGIPLPARIRRLIANSKFLRRLALAPYVARPAALRPDIAAVMLAGAGAPGVFPALRTGFRAQTENLWQSISHPTLVIAGRNDKIAPVQDIDDFATQQAVQNVVILDDCGHCPMFEHPDTFNRELLAFLDAPAS